MSSEAAPAYKVSHKQTHEVMANRLRDTTKSVTVYYLLEWLTYRVHYPQHVTECIELWVNAIKTGKWERPERVVDVRMKGKP